jgi:hypothetical protein
LVERRELVGADHTFSRLEWKQQVTGLAIDWLQRQ